MMGMARALIRLFSKSTYKIRYKIIFTVIKYVTPRLLERIRAEDYIARTPRPSTRFMKMYFKDKPLVGAEIGVQFGENAFSLLNELNISKLYLIDIYENERIYFEAIKRLGVYGNIIQFIIKKSVEASKYVKESLDFVYIDADHKYDFVYEDLESWFPLVREGGVICGHDVLNEIDVLKALKDWCDRKGVIYHIDPPDWYFIKHARAQLGDIE